MKDKVLLVDEIWCIICVSIGNRVKESFIVDYINEINLDFILDKVGIMELFFIYVQERQKSEVIELIIEENLNVEVVRCYIVIFLRCSYVSENGIEFNVFLLRMSFLNFQYLIFKQCVFQKVVVFVEKFKGIGGEI